MKTLMAIGVVLLFSIVGTAQIITGTVQGVITDQSGAILPGVSVSVRNMDTNQARNVLSNETGTYIAPLLSPGNYEVTAGYTGFKTEVRSGLVLHVEQKLNVNFVLQVGAVSERLEVTESAPLVQSDTA